MKINLFNVNQIKIMFSRKINFCTVQKTNTDRYIEKKNLKYNKAKK